MAKDINAELLNAIKETLPETQVGLIKEALVERDNLKAEVADLTEQLDETEERRIELQSELRNASSENSKLGSTISDLESKLAIVETENQRLVKADVERRAAEAEAELRGVQTTQELFLRNTIVRETVQHQVVDETPNMISQYTPSGTVMSQQGTNKIHRGVTDVKETESASVAPLTVDKQQ